MKTMAPPPSSASSATAGLLLLSLILLTTVGSSSALKCYECNSRNTTACADEKPPESLKKDCSEHTEGSKYTLCRKIVQTIEYEVNGLKPETRIIRSCGWDASSYLNACYQRSGFGGRQEVCTCTTDLCNSATRLPATQLTLFSLTAAILLFLTPLNRLL